MEMNEMLTKETLKTTPTSELLVPLMESIEELQRTPEGRAQLAANAAQYARAIKMVRAAAAAAMRREIGMEAPPEEG